MGERILVIDDNAINRQVFEKTLEMAGYDVVCAESGFEGIDRFEEARPALIVLDMHMPHFTGADFLIDLQSRDPANVETPVLMVSGDQNVGIHSLCPLWRNLRFMLKPIDTGLFIAEVRSQIADRADADAAVRASA